VAVLANDTTRTPAMSMTVTAAIDQHGALGAVSIAADGKSINYDAEWCLQLPGSGESATVEVSYTAYDRTDGTGLSDTANGDHHVIGRQRRLMRGLTLPARTSDTAVNWRCSHNDTRPGHQRCPDRHGGLDQQRCALGAVSIAADGKSIILTMR
jgi:hypothetical protein